MAAAAAPMLVRTVESGVGQMATQAVTADRAQQEQKLWMKAEKSLPEHCSQEIQKESEREREWERREKGRERKKEKGLRERPQREGVRKKER